MVVSVFEDIGFTYMPGATNKQYMASSSEIDEAKLQDTQFPINNNISVNFRFWKPSEIMANNSRCSLCSVGTYSLFWNSTQCSQRLENAVWFGGTEVNVDK